MEQIMQLEKRKDWLKVCVIVSVILTGLFGPVTGYLNTYFPFASRSFLFAVLLVILFGGIYLLRQRKIWNTLKEGKLYSIFFVLLFLVATIKYILDITAGKNITFFTAYAIPVYILYSIVIFALMKEIPNLHNWLLSAYCTSFCILFLLFQNYFVEANGTFRAVGMYGGSTELGLYALFSALSALVLISQNKNYKIINYLFLGISLAAVFLSGSRGSLFAALFGLILYGLFSIGHIIRANKKRLISSLLVIVLVTSALIAVFLPTESDKRNSTRYDKLGFDYYNALENDELTREEIDKLINAEKGEGLSGLIERFFYGDSEASSFSNNLRLRIWVEYIKVIAKHPVTGISFDLSQRPVIGNRDWDPHNTFLYLASRYGVIVTIVFLAWVIIAAVGAVFQKKKSLFYIAVFSMLAAMLANAFVQDLVNTSTLWIALGLTLFAQSHVKSKAEKTEEKKILLVRNYSGDGGIERQISNIATGLGKQGYQVYLLTNKPSPFSERLAQCGAKIYMSQAKGLLKKSLEIRRICKQNNIKLIQSHMWKESFYARGARFLTRSIVHIYRVHTYIDCSFISEKKKKIYHIADRVTSFWVDRYVSINMFNVTELRRRTHIPARKICVVHDGVAQPGDPVCMESGRWNREQLAMIANLIIKKGHDILIEGIGLLKEEGYPLKAYIFGGVPGEGTPSEDTTVKNELQQKVRELGLEENIVFCGRSQDIAKSLQPFSFVVLPSYAEGTPNCLLEAMSLKKIAVASNVGGIPEFIEDGVDGFLHEVGSARAFADKIKEILALDDAQLDAIGEAGYQTWKREYSVEQLIEGLVSVYRQLSL